MSGATGRSVSLRRTATILVVDDAPAHLALLRDVLEAEGYAVLTCSTADEALAAIGAAGPDLLILDVRLAGRPDWEVFERVRGDPDTAAIPCLVCSADVEQLRERGPDLIEQGCRILAKPFDLDELLGHVRALAGGNLVPLAPPATPEASGPAPRLLTSRQREIAALIARGYSNAEIAAELVLTKGTAANHVQQILARLGFRNRAQIATWAVERGLHRAGPGERGGGAHTPGPSAR